jgi:hypothetical protein
VTEPGANLPPAGRLSLKIEVRAPGVVTTARVRFWNVAWGDAAVLAVLGGTLLVVAARRRRRPIGAHSCRLAGEAVPQPDRAPVAAS